MGVIIAAGAIGGLKLDQKFDLAPLFTLILTILASVMAIYIAIKDVLNMNK